MATLPPMLWPNYIHRLRARIVVQQLIQIRKIVHEMVAVAGAGRREPPKPRQSGGDDEAPGGKGLAEGIDHELPGRAHIHPAMQQQQRRRARLRRAPGAYVVVQRADAHAVAAAGA